MTKRGKVGQARHDNKVRQRLEHYKGKGYSVKADLPGRAKPQKIGGRIPDIIARKNKDIVVEEIETPATLRDDSDQQSRLRAGSEKLDAKFKIVVARNKR